MGSDKAFLTSEAAGAAWSGPLVMQSVRALRGAGAGEVRVVGGDRDRLESLGLDVMVDRFPGAGPLGGIVTALGAASYPIVVVLTCDLVAIDAPTVRGLVEALDGAPEAVGAVAVADGRRQVLTAAYRRSAEPVLREAFASGERSVNRAVRTLPIVEVDHLDPDRLVDLDSPADIENYAGPHHDAAPTDPPG